MARLKTHKALAKRVRKTGSGRWVRRAAGQDHFNARDRGSVTKRKRRDSMVAKSDRRNVERLHPHAR